MRQVLFIAVLVLTLLPAVYAEGQGVTRDFKFTYESRDGDTYDVSRMTIETKWGWKLDRRSKLKLTIPYAFLEVEDQAGVSSKANGLKDIRMDIQRTIREANGGQPGARMYLTLSLPTGTSALNAEEVTAVGAISASGEGFAGAEFGRGFGATVGYGLIKGDADSKSRMEYKLSYVYRASFDTSVNSERTDRDQFQFDIISARNPSPKKAITWSFSAIFKFDEDVTTAGTTTTASGHQDYKITYGIETQINSSLKSKLLFGYDYRGVVDVLGDSSLQLPNMDLGDRLRFRYLWSKEQRPGKNFMYGFHWMNTGETTQNGVAVLDSKRSEGAVVIGLTRDLSGNSRFHSELQIGLTDEARSLVGSLGWMISF